MKAAHAEERRRLDAGLAERQRQEQRQRAERLRGGLAGLLDRISGRYRQLSERNEREAWEALQRDRDQRQRLTDDQLAERRALQLRIMGERNAHHDRVADLHRDLARQLEADRSSQKSEREAWLDQQQAEAARERQDWLDAQQQSRDEERARWLAEQQSHVRQLEPEPQEDRLQWLTEQQRPIAPHVTPDPPAPITPQFNAQAAPAPIAQPVEQAALPTPAQPPPSQAPAPTPTPDIGPSMSP